MRILDLFCGAGLVADGLVAAGWEVVGVDLYRQKHYPGPFIQHDATTLDMRFIRSFDAVWASPPCLRDTELHASARREQRAHNKAPNDHPELIVPTRKILQASGLPYVIENVSGAALMNPVILCGSMFGLCVEDAGVSWHLERHRKFETNWVLEAPAPCRHLKPVVGVYGGHARKRAKSAGGRGTCEGWTRRHPEIMAAAMGVARTDPRYPLTAKEIGDGIPPAYAKYVGEQLLDHIEMQRFVYAR
jgi:DNA (cytosine-5)-methyltransferase 1